MEKHNVVNHQVNNLNTRTVIKYISSRFLNVIYIFRFSNKFLIPFSGKYFILSRWLNINLSLWFSPLEILSFKKVL